MRILVTGGAGFVGSSLVGLFKQERPKAEVVAHDNLKRRGSELALNRLRQAGVGFVDGDVRIACDLDNAGWFDLMLECSAEATVRADYDGALTYLLDSNLTGVANCLETALRHKAVLALLSSSRVHPMQALQDIPLEVSVVRAGACGAGWSERGVAADFPLTDARSLCGATKLAAELAIEGYRAHHGLAAIVNRCGVPTGPWQTGKAQGAFVLWTARHLFSEGLTCIGYRGAGRKVRDFLHVEDLYDLIKRQLDWTSFWADAPHNVGGGPALNLPLAKPMRECRARRPQRRYTERSRGSSLRRAVLCDRCRGSTSRSCWVPKRHAAEVLDDILSWLRDQRDVFRPVLTA